MTSGELTATGISDSGVVVDGVGVSLPGNKPQADKVKIATAKRGINAFKNRIPFIIPCL